MLIEIIPEAYDVHGRSIMEPITRRKGKVFHPTYPMKRFLTHPLEVKCASLEEIRDFLDKCRYVSDRKQFNKADYWFPPEEFEKVRKGDCEDFALWAWRQLINLGIPCRFVIGESGRYGSGHAWITLELNGKHYLMECQASCMQHPMPRLDMVRYKPEVSVEYDGKDLKYFAHERKSYNPTFREALPLAIEWVLFWSGWWIKLLIRLPLLPYCILRNIWRKHRAKA